MNEEKVFRLSYLLYMYHNVGVNLVRKSIRSVELVMEMIV